MESDKGRNWLQRWTESDPVILESSITPIVSSGIKGFGFPEEFADLMIEFPKFKRESVSLFL